MDLIPGYPNYLDSGYQFPDTVSPDHHDTPVTQADRQAPQPLTGGADRQRSLSGDRVVILPRRASESEPETWSPGPPPPQPPHGHHDRLRHPAAAAAGPEWRVPPHYPPESLYPGKR